MLAVGGVGAACDQTATPTRQIGAEPSVAESPTAPPAGTVLPLPAGSKPEGVAEDPVTHTVVISLRDPDRLALINTDTLRVRVRSAPGEGRHLILAALGGPVLLPSEDRNTLYELALPSGAAVQATPVLELLWRAARTGSQAIRRRTPCG
jgi:hypothetical protein